MTALRPQSLKSSSIYKSILLPYRSNFGEVQTKSALDRPDTVIQKNGRRNERLQGEKNAVAKMLFSIWKDNATMDPICFIEISCFIFSKFCGKYFFNFVYVQVWFMPSICCLFCMTTTNLYSHLSHCRGGANQPILNFLSPTSIYYPPPNFRIF